jgi:beta-D-galactosyl-(1->4)-L-rhamnose phosphorylase
LDGDTQVLAEKDGSPRISARRFGRGRSVYFSGYKFSPQNTRLLHRALYWAAGRESDFGYWTCSNIYTECAYYPKSDRIVVINNSDKKEQTKVFDSDRMPVIDVRLESYGIKIIDL